MHAKASVLNHQGRQYIRVHVPTAKIIAANAFDTKHFKVQVIKSPLRTFKNI